MRLLTRLCAPAVLLAAVMVAAPSPCRSGTGEGMPVAGTKSWQTPLVIPAADLKTTGEDPEGHFFSANGYITGEGYLNAMVAPVYLPSGATVERVEARIRDFSDSCASNANIQVQLDRVHYGNGTYENMAYMTSSGSASAMQTIGDDSISNPTINPMVYAYWVHVHFCSMSHEIYSVVIYYSGG